VEDVMEKDKDKEEALEEDMRKEEGLGGVL
jgi:hypothetical protein